MPGLERETLLTDCRRFIPAFDGLLIRIAPQLWGNSVAINFILHICIMLSQYTVSCSAEQSTRTEFINNPYAAVSYLCREKDQYPV